MRTNRNTAFLVNETLWCYEGKLTNSGALVVKTGKFTGRNTKDKYIVDNSEGIWKEQHKTMTQDAFNALKERFDTYVSSKVPHVQQLKAAGSLHVEVITELAWHSLFMRSLLQTPKDYELEDYEADLTIKCFPSFEETIIAIDLKERLVLIGGTAYAGEMKKAVFSVLNYLLPTQGVLPMHCAANASKDGEDVALFFGLSGTGKTTLSTCSSRLLVGDDEHGWDYHGIFNFEGGCYAKTTGISPTNEPEIYKAANKFGAILENVVVNNGDPDFNDNTITSNTRCAYPRRFLSNVSSDTRMGKPNNVFLLSYDAFGVLPLISKLTPEQALKYFLLGYTSKMVGTEQGITEPEAVFSTCFGAPFMFRKPEVYGNLFQQRLRETGATCWLVNTGISSKTGERIPLKLTRSLINDAINGDIETFNVDPNFGFAVPKGFPVSDDRAKGLMKLMDEQLNK